MTNTPEEKTAPVVPTAEDKPAEHAMQGDVPCQHAVEGFIERIEAQRVSGWAWDRLAPEVFLDIDILLDGKLLATTRADRFREDLKRGTGDGCHAFQAFFDDPLPEPMRHRITAVARSGKDSPATGLVNLVGNGSAHSLGGSASPVASTSAGAGPVDGGPLAAGVKQWLMQIAAADRKLQATSGAVLKEMQEALATVSATAVEVTNTVKDVQATQEQLAQHLAAFEVFQVRFEATLKGLEEKANLAGKASRRPDRGLRAAVAAIAALSTASLAIGLWSILGG